MKRGIALFLTGLLCLTLLLPVAAEGETYIFDEENTLSNEARQALNDRAAQLYDDWGYRVAFAITDDPPGDTLAAYLESVYTAAYGSDDGLIVGVDLDNGVWDEYRAGAAQTAFLWSDVEQLLTAYDYAETYASGVQAYLDAAERLFSGIANEETPHYTETVHKGLYARLIDAADLLTSDEEAALAAKLDAVSERQSADVVVVTVDDAGYSLWDYTNRVYDENGYGKRGILLLISMAERDWYILGVGDKLSGMVDDERDDMADAFLSDLSAGRYAKAFSIYADECDKVIDWSVNGKPLSTTWIVVALVVGLVAALIGTGSMKGDLKSVRAQAAASQYVTPGSLQVRNAQEIFLYTHVTRTERQRESSSSGGGGGGSFSSGSRSGGGGKF